MKGSALLPSFFLGSSLRSFFLLGFLTAAGSVALGQAGSEGEASAPQVDQPEGLRSAVSAWGEFDAEITAAVAMVRPILVQITVQREARLRTLSSSPFGSGPLASAGIELAQNEAVSGLLVDELGHIATVAEPVDGATRLVVQFEDGSQEKARLVNVDPRLNIGVVKVPPRPFPPGVRLERTASPLPGSPLPGSPLPGSPLPGSPLLDSPAPSAGILTLVVGHGLSEDSGVTLALLSGVDRTVEANGVVYERLLQVGASCGAGDRGGVVVGAGGALLGLVVIRDPPAPVHLGEAARLPSTFAVPMARVWQAVEAITAQEREIPETGSLPVEPWIGVRGRDVDEALRRHLDLKGNQGVLVEAVVNSSPAGEAGIQAFDIILTWQGEPVYGIGDLALRVARTKVGSQVQVEVLRSGARQERKIKVSRW
ncbi:MAG: PDZ domain-containing protein [Planctomycetota bacterium]